MSIPIVSRAIKIRQYLATDIENVARIQEDAVLHGCGNFDLVPQSATTMAAKFLALEQQSYPILVSTCEGEVCGYAYAAPYRDRPGYRWTVEDSVYVASEHRNSGVGKRLLSNLIDRSTELGFRQMIAVIGDSENHGSIRLHEHHGFSLAGTMRNVGFKHRKWLDVIIMQRSLGAEPDSLPDETVFPGNLFKPE